MNVLYICGRYNDIIYYIERWAAAMLSVLQYIQLHTALLVKVLQQLRTTNALRGRPTVM